MFTNLYFFPFNVNLIFLLKKYSYICIMKNKIKENQLVKHNHLGLVRMFEYGDKYCLVKILDNNLKQWTVKRVQTRTLDIKIKNL